MKERAPKMCITCQHYKSFYCCVQNNRYISYLECDKKNSCKQYRLNDKYRRGGEWYNSRPDKK